jgi:hypothetical protein
MDTVPQYVGFLEKFRRERRWLRWRNAVLPSACHSAHRLQECEQRYMAASGLENEE